MSFAGRVAIQPICFSSGPDALNFSHVMLRYVLPWRAPMAMEQINSPINRHDVSFFMLVLLRREARNPTRESARAEPRSGCSLGHERATAHRSYNLSI